MPRNSYIDMLRVVAILLLIPNHAAGMFAPLSPLPFPIEGWAVLVVKAIMAWEMPVVMLVAGWAMKRSLEKRSVRQFLKERRDRVLYPAIFILAVCVPLDAAMLGKWQVTMAHGWFLVYLLVFSLVIAAIPDSPRQKLFGASGLLLIVLPLHALLIFTSIMEAGFWFMLFIAGFYIESHVARKVAVPYVALGIALLAFFDHIYQISLFARALLGIGLVSMPVTLGRPVPPRLQQASIAFYVLHYPVVIFLAVIAWNAGMGSPPAFAFMMLAFPVTLCLALASARWKATRVALGVKDRFQSGLQDGEG